MTDQDFGGVAKLAVFPAAALFLDVAQLIEGFVELAGEAAGIEPESGEDAVGVDDVEGDFLFGIGGRERAGEDIRFEQRNAVETPGSVGKFLDELGFGGRGGLIFVEQAAAMVFVGGAVFGGEDGGGGGQSVAEGVEGGTALAGVGARAGGMLGIFAVDGGAALVPTKDGVGGWGGGLD